MDWMLGGIIGTFAVVLMLCVIKILSMKKEIEWLDAQMTHMIADRNHFGYYDSGLDRVELWSHGKDAIEKAVRERLKFELNAGIAYLPYVGTTSGFPVGKVLDKLLALNGLELSHIHESFEIKKAGASKGNRKDSHK